MEYTLFADESGTDTKSSCYSIGCLLIPKENVQKFRFELLKLIKILNIPSDRELKWATINRRYAVINLLIEVVNLIQRSPASFICKVTWKRYYRKWSTNEEGAFYTSYTMLMRYCAATLNAQITANIDNKSDSYDKQHEIVQTISNHQLKGLGRIDSVKKCDSKSDILIQITDLLTGAVNSAHNYWINDGDIEIHKGKLLAIRKVAECLGWDFLHFDTYPNSDFNIWHFPKNEFRGIPETKELSPNFDVAHVTRDDI